MEWVLAVWLMGDLKIAQTYSSEAACRAAGRSYIERKIGDTYICSPKQIYRPKSKQQR